MPESAGPSTEAGRRHQGHSGCCTIAIEREAASLTAPEVGADESPLPLDVERLLGILREERSAVPRGPAHYWQGYQDGLETAMRRTEYARLSSLNEGGSAPPEPEPEYCDECSGQYGGHAGWCSQATYAEREEYERRSVSEPHE